MTKLRGSHQRTPAGAKAAIDKPVQMKPPVGARDEGKAVSPPQKRTPWAR